MSKKEKLLKKAIDQSKDFKFEELNILLKHFGFKKIKTNTGSHFKWRNNEKCITYMAPRKNPVKIIYIKNLVKILKIHFNLKNHDH